MFFSNLTRRAIIPIHHSLMASPTPLKDQDNATKLRDLLQLSSANSVPDFHNIQGDVYLAFPRVSEYFVFFKITNPAQFRKDLQSYTPTSSYDVSLLLDQIDGAKQVAKETGNKVKHVDALLSQLAFSRKGLDALGIVEKLKDIHFDNGPMRKEKPVLGDTGPWDPVFDDEQIDGVFMIAATTLKMCDDAAQKVRTDFQSSIFLLPTEIGNVLPERVEHFGYRDGVSQPAPRGLVTPNPGQLQCDPGVIIMGYEGDPVLDNCTSPQDARPSWTKDGSLLVVRKLYQDVDGWNNYLQIHGKDWKRWDPSLAPQKLSNEEAAELWGARLVGRWKSGAPIALAHYREDTVLGHNNQLNNNFDYSVPNVPYPTPIYCPFSAHVRKTAPRNLNPYISKKALEANLIIRSGIPYGDIIQHVAKPDRGLLFTCYQSCIDNGFMAQTRNAGNNDYPPTEQGIRPNWCQDSVIGSPPPPSFHYTGNPEDDQFWVTSKGGEYFFVPAISTLKAWAADDHPPALDIVFLQDSTGSQQPYIDAAKAGIQSIINALLAKNIWKPADVRFGLIAFRDYPPQDYTYPTGTKIYPFTSNISDMQSYLGELKADGGGDGCEAQTAALWDALNVDWKFGAKQIVVLITDAPPHGIGDVDDLMPKGDPNQRDPQQIARKMLGQGISLFVLACEPTLSNYYDKAHDYYTALAETTHGHMIGLAQADSLPGLIANHVLEAVSKEKLIRQHTTDIAKQVFFDKKSTDDVARTLHAKLQANGVQLDQCVFDDIYQHSSDGDANVKTWLAAKTLAEGKDKLRPVTGNRIKYGYRNGGAQNATVKSQPVTYAQTQSIVKQVVARYSNVN